MTAEAAIILDELKLSLVAIQSPWANRNQAAAYTGRCARSVDRAADMGIIKRYNKSGIPMFKKVELDAWIEKGKAE